MRKDVDEIKKEATNLNNLIKKTKNEIQKMGKDMDEIKKVCTSKTFIR